MSTAVTIECLTSATEQDYKDILRLLPQLSQTYSTVSREDFDKAVKDSHTHLFVARGDGRIIGTATLVVHYTILGIRSRLEDMVVDKSHRGKGVGKQLMDTVLEAARKHGVIEIEFSSRPQRTEAITFYKRYGFIQKETNVYRMQL